MSVPRSDVERELGASRRMLQVSERELQRILLDIHDGPVQYMYAALSQLDLLRRALDDDSSAGRKEVLERADRIRRLLEDGLGEVRSFIGAFRPPEFETRELRSLLEGLALQHEAATDTRVVLEVEGGLADPPLPVKIALYRVLQEALSNAYRHGGASRVSVRVGRLADVEGRQLRMEIADDGSGFDAAGGTGAAAGAGHFGLAGMRDRAEMIGGGLSVHSVPGKGTTIVVEVPA